MISFRGAFLAGLSQKGRAPPSVHRFWRPSTFVHYLWCSLRSLGWGVRDGFLSQKVVTVPSVVNTYLVKRYFETVEIPPSQNFHSLFWAPIEEFLNPLCLFVVILLLTTAFPSPPCLFILLGTRGFFLLFNGVSFLPITIYFDAQIFSHLASGNPFKLVPVSFWCVPITIYVLPYFPAQ